MAASKSELWTQLLNEIKILDNIFKFGVSNSPNYLGMEEVLQEAWVGDHVGSSQQQLANIRSQLSSILRNASGFLTPCLLELARIGYSSSATSASVALNDIYDGMIATETVKERDFTFGSVSAGGSNVGTGTVLRLTKDAQGHDLEGGFANAGITKILVVKDFASGKTKGNEEASLFGSGQVKVDELVLGTAPSSTAVLLAKMATDGLLSNAGFETITGTAPAISVDSWTMGDAADFDEETTTIYRGSKALEFVDNGTITQYLNTITLDTTKPIFVRLLFNRVSSCDGTLTLRLGTQTEAVSLVAQTGWTALTLGDGASTKGWYENFQENYSGNGIRLEISLASRTVGSLLIDEVTVIQPTAYDGKFYALFAGNTDFLEDDFFTFTDSVANTGRTQYWLARVFGKYLPHTSGAPTYADA